MGALAAIELQSVSLPSTLNVPQVALPHAERDRFDLSSTRAHLKANPKSKDAGRRQIEAIAPRVRRSRLRENSSWVQQEKTAPLTEVVLAERRPVLLHPLVIQGESLDDVLLQDLRCPNAKLRRPPRIDAIADGNDCIKVIEEQFARNRPFPLVLNLFHFGTSCRLPKLPIGIDVF